MAKLLTTTDAAEALEISRVRVLQLITSGRLPAEKVGRDYLINPSDLSKVRDRPTGRPKKR